MLALLLFAAVACHPVAQGASSAAAVAVRGDAELSPAAAFASAERRAHDHIRSLWRTRADHLARRHCPRWLPSFLAARTVEQWLAELPVRRLMTQVDREDTERIHEFGNSYQTTIWVAERPQLVERSERSFAAAIRGLQERSLFKAVCVLIGWFGMAVLLCWTDRLSRGYMTGRLWAIGLLCSAALPSLLFLV